MKELSNPKGELSVLLTGDSEMKKLNSTFRNVSRTTDVLSFPSKGGPGPATLGDIIISLPTARRQAKAIGSSLERETLFLLVHGLLHILGYDHERSKKSAAEMERLQKRLMSVGYSI